MSLVYNRLLHLLTTASTPKENNGILQALEQQENPSLYIDYVLTTRHIQPHLTPKQTDLPVSVAFLCIQVQEDLKFQFFILQLLNLQ